MSRVGTWLAGVVLASLAAVLLLTPASRAGEVGFVEDFALAKDRTTALKQLIPGTDDYYYYHCLHHLNTAQYDRAKELADTWRGRRANTPPGLTEIDLRHALLTYEKNPQKILDFLRNHLGLRFDHQKETAAAAVNLPTSLDQNLISRATLRDSYLRGWNDYEDAAVDWLAGQKLDWSPRRTLLQRLKRPDVPDLPRIIVEDMTTPRFEAPFGTYPIHRLLTLGQLDEVLKLKPDLLNQANFVNAYLAKLQPGADDDFRRDRKVALAYLERLEKFVARLDPVHNGLKAHVLFHRLAFDRAGGVYDRDRFMTYVQLPRLQPYMNPKWSERPECQRWPAQLNSDFSGVTLLPAVNADEQLVRSYLKHFFGADNASTREYEPYISDTWLRNLHAETQVELGRGDPEVWASKLPPELFRSLKERVDIDFAFTNRTDFAADEPVSLDLHVKNVPTMLVKVFEVNTQTWYRTRLKEIDTDINLDGLVPNAEKVHKYDDSPFRRQDRRFAFPELNKPGVYVIDFIGSGKSSRALVRKGHLRPLVSTGPAGQNVRVVDEQNRPVADATVWLGNVEYAPDRNGVVTVPFTAEPGRRPVVLSRGEFSCLDFIEHRPEAYRLAAGIHVDRESLLTQRVAPVVIRPGLFLNDTPVSLKLLEDVKLRITSVDHGDIPTSTEVPNFQLFEDREAVHEVRVPARLKSLSVVLTARVKNLSTGKTVDLNAGRTFQLNDVERSDKVEDLHLARFGPNYVVEVLGRTGEFRPDRPVSLAIKHRFFKQPVHVTLKSDQLGRVNLGPLADIVTVTATGPEGTAHTWTLSTDAHAYRQAVHARAGDAVSLPYLGTADKPSREEFALFEVRGSDIRADRFDAIAVEDGGISIRGLAAGDYDLYLKRTGERIRVRVVAGVEQAGHVLGATRHLEMPGLKPVHIQSVTGDADGVKIRLRDFSKFARVHVFATRYQPAFDAFRNLSSVRDAELGGVVPGHAESVYLTGRNIGDEYRYVLDRKGMRKYPGNMLERPALLLNPWAVRTTETGEQVAVTGDEFRAGGQFEPAKGIPPAGRPEPQSGWMQSSPGDFANLDFLADASAVALNLVPDKDGLVSLTAKDVGPHAMIHVVAVDPLGTTSRSVSLAERPAAFADLRLKSGLDPARHFTQQKQVTVVPKGQEFVIADVADSRFQMYDSLAKVYGFYSTLTKDANLAEFGFVLTWPKLKAEEKRALYSKYACHELSFFVSKKDPEFFAEVVQPYLKNKKDKTFLDHYLLGDDLSRFLKPWEYGRLNTVERVLLAQRMPGEPARVARHLDDMLRLIPQNVDRELFQFNVGVMGDLANDDNGIVAEVTELRLKREQEKLKALTAEFEAKPNSGAERMDPRTTAGAAAPEMPAKPGGLGGGSGMGMGGRPKSMEDQKEAKGFRDGTTKRGYGKGLGPDGDKDGGMNAFGYFPEGLYERQAVRRLFRKLDPTQEWAENNYYKLRIAQQVAELVPVGPFWLDYARHDGKGPFLSKHLGDASRNFTEMMFALSVLDLPFEAGRHDVKFEAGKMTVRPAGQMIAFHEEVRPAEGHGGSVPILVSQNFYRHGDRFRFREEGGEKYDKFVADEFVVHTVYGCQVVVTNPTSSRQKLTVLLQLPLGAIPVLNGQFTKSVPLDLEPYRTQTIDYFFYFPKAGKFPQFPVHVAKNEQFVIAGQPATFNVVPRATKLDTSSWDHVSQNGTNEEVLAFLARENVRALNLDKMAFRLKDRAFFEAATRLLDSRHLYHPTTWSYGLLHADVPTARQFLLHQDGLIAQCGGPIDTPLLTIDPVARHQYEHLEYKPLVNARAHALGNRRQIVNDALSDQYHKILKNLTYGNTPDDADTLAVVYYLLLQDRTEEALDAFARVNPEKLGTRMQYDYCAAYLELYKEQPQKARAIATAYKFHPVDRWRNAFAAVLAQVDEIEGKGGKVVDADDRNQAQGGLAATEPGFELAVKAQGVSLTWQNVDAVRVNYYLMDVELLFSTSPFVQRAGGQFATIKPNGTQLLKLPLARNRHTFALPPEFEGRNVLVEVVAAGKTRSVAHLASSLTVAMSENYGQLKVTETGGNTALGKVYVKVYARLADGSVKFHKDGYTDLRGRFDYANVNTPERQAVEKFAVLVLSDDRGAVIREVAPPQK